jgi:hypothetical protein
MQIHFPSLCWRRCPAKQIANTIHARQKLICIPFLHYPVGLSLKTESYANTAWGCTTNFLQKQIDDSYHLCLGNGILSHAKIY